MEKTRIREGDFFELIKSISFSVFGVFVFFMPMLIKEEIVSPVLFISDLIYIKYQEFIYFCVIVFIVLLFHIVYNPQYILPILGYLYHAFFAYCPPFCPPLTLPKDSPKNAVSIWKNKS